MANEISWLSLNRSSGNLPPVPAGGSDIGGKRQNTQPKELAVPPHPERNDTRTRGSFGNCKLCLTHSDEAGTCGTIRISQ